jgi:hypothetical protein
VYTLVLIGHSWLRWIVLALGIAATISAINGEGVEPGARADRLGLLFMMALDVQMLLGLLLYLVLSPLTVELMQNMGTAMRDPRLRFWAIDHAATMLIAVILVHVGRVLARKAASADARRSRLIICFGLATFLMLISIPWPGLPNGRPLFRI